MKKLQDAIGYHFQDEALLKNAMTHSSYANEKAAAKVTNGWSFWVIRCWAS